VLGPGHRRPLRVGIDIAVDRADQQVEGGRVAVGEAAERPDDVELRCRAHRLAGAGVAIRPGRDRRHGPLHQQVVVAVDCQPRDGQTAREERLAHRVQQTGHLGEAVAAAGQVVRAALRVPVAGVVDIRPGDTVVPAVVAGVRDDRGGAVEQVEVGLELVALRVVGRVTGDDREVDRCARHRPAQLGVDRQDHRLDDVVGEQLLRPVGADDPELPPERRVEVDVPVEQFHPGR
jgi:hypothetical protein